MAGATIRWAGGTSTDVSVGANWVGGAVPAVGDFALWDSITTYGPSSGTFTNAVARFEATDGAGTATSRDVGTAASPLTLSAISGYVKFSNRGNVYVTSSGTVTAASFEMGTGGIASLSGGTWTTTTATKVSMEIGASAVMTTCQSNTSNWNVATNGTAITTFTGTGLLVCTSRDITTLNLDGLIAQGVLKGTTAVTTANIIAGALLNHQSSGTITTLNLRSLSRYTPAGNPNTTATITTANRWTGSVLSRSSPGFTLVITTDTMIGPESGSTSGGAS